MTLSADQAGSRLVLPGTFRDAFQDDMYSSPCISELFRRPAVWIVAASHYVSAAMSPFRHFRALLPEQPRCSQPVGSYAIFCNTSNSSFRAE